MAKIITVAHQKGGVGKSTLALNLAYRFAREVPTALTDMDPQGSTSRLKGMKGTIDVLDFKSVEQLKSQPFQVIFIDTAPYLNKNLVEVFVQSDFVLIPTKAGLTDMMAISSTVALIRQARERNADLKAAIVLNMVKPRTSLTKGALEVLEEYELPILSNIGDRVSFVSTFLTGGVSSGTDLQAKAEIEQLSQEILNLL